MPCHEKSAKRGGFVVGSEVVVRVSKHFCSLIDAVVDIRLGKAVAFVRFEGIVQEIFDVQLLAGVRYPDVLEPTDEHVGAAFTIFRQRDKDRDAFFAHGTFRLQPCV